MLSISTTASALWVLGLCLVAAITDARHGRIPNWLTLPSLLLAPLVHGLVSGPGALGASLLGAMASAVVPLLMFRGGGLGGGDLKLFCALGAIVGVRLGVTLQLAAFGLALLFSLARLAYHGRLLATLLRAGVLLLGPLATRGPWRASAPEPQEAIILGPAILAASALTLLWERVP